jgi:FkbM family methyltransferase
MEPARAWRPPSSAVTSEWLASELDVGRVADVEREERALFDNLAGSPDTPLVLFGAGNLGRRALRGIRESGVEPLGFADNNAALQGTTVEGLKVFSPAEAVSSFGRQAAFVVTIWTPHPTRQLAFPSVSRQLGDLGLGSAVCVVPFVPLFWKHAEALLPYTFLDLPHRIYEDAGAVRAAYGLLSDRLSREEYLLQLAYLLSTMDSMEVPCPSEDEWYFPRELFTLREDEVFIDCGAYDGDTLSCFLDACGGRFAEIVAFEPDPEAFPRLEKRARDLPPVHLDRVRVIPQAVGASNGQLRFESDGSPGAHLSDGGQTIVECVTLDGALAGIRPTFIKMDIEGAEDGALDGAGQTIREHRPILAVCVYHRQSDFYRLPAKIREMCPDYSLFLRRQAGDGDLVCFAIPNERVLT